MLAAHILKRVDLKRPMASLALALALAAAVAVAGCAPSAPSSTAQRTATPAPTATAAPRTLYQADFTQRAGEWTLPPHWSIANGKLLNDGKGLNSITIPYLVTATSYTLTVQMRLIAINGSGYNNQYLFQGETPSGELLYSAGVNSLNQQNHGFSQLYPAQPDPQQNGNFGTADFTPGINTRDYVVQVDGPYVVFLLSGSDIGMVKSATPLAPARIALVDQTIQLEIESITITTP